MGACLDALDRKYMRAKSQIDWVTGCGNIRVQRSGIFIDKDLVLQLWMPISWDPVIGFAHMGTCLEVLDRVYIRAKF
jgi:hypothetical protein